MNRFIILFVLYVIAQAKPLSCPADVITIPYDSQKPHFIQKTHSILFDIPAKMFKGLTHPNFQFLDQMHLDKKSNIWQITFHANKPILFKYKQSAKQLQLVFSDKTCLAHQSNKKVIVIDPGHGGKDPGAISSSKALEKNITLAIAKKIKKHLEKNGDFQVILTRKTDIFIPLRKRINLAAKHNPDIFISIHADSAPRKSARGMSVYALSVAGATSEMARLLADHNNKQDSGKSEPVGDILMQLTQTATILSSLDLGSHILTHIKKPQIKHIDHVEQAGFVVLKAFDVPSVLIETGFVSNNEEAKQLQSPAHQDAIAKSIAAGVRSYLSAQTPKNITDTVQVGDTLSKIARRNHVALSDLLKSNPKISANHLRIGQKIIIPRKST